MTTDSIASEVEEDRTKANVVVGAVEEAVQLMRVVAVVVVREAKEEKDERVKACHSWLSRVIIQNNFK